MENVSGNCLSWLLTVILFQKFEVENPAGYAKSTVEWILIPWKAF